MNKFNGLATRAEASLEELECAAALVDSGSCVGNSEHTSVLSPAAPPMHVSSPSCQNRAPIRPHSPRTQHNSTNMSSLNHCVAKADMEGPSYSSHAHQPYAEPEKYRTAAMTETAVPTGKPELLLSTAMNRHRAPRLAVLSTHKAEHASCCSSGVGKGSELLLSTARGSRDLGITSESTRALTKPSELLLTSVRCSSSASSRDAGWKQEIESCRSSTAAPSGGRAELLVSTVMETSNAGAISSHRVPAESRSGKPELLLSTAMKSCGSDSHSGSQKAESSRSTHGAILRPELVLSTTRSNDGATRELSESTPGSAEKPDGLLLSAVRSSRLARIARMSTSCQDIGEMRKEPSELLLSSATSSGSAQVSSTGPRTEAAVTPRGKSELLLCGSKRSSCSSTVRPLDAAALDTSASMSHHAIGVEGEEKGTCTPLTPRKDFLDASTADASSGNCSEEAYSMDEAFGPTPCNTLRRNGDQGYQADYSPCKTDFFSTQDSELLLRSMSPLELPKSRWQKEYDEDVAARELRLRCGPTLSNGKLRSKA